MIGSIEDKGRNAEASIIGGCLNDGGAFLRISHLVEARHFGDSACRQVFTAIKEMTEGFEQVDIVLVAERLEQRGVLGKIGGIDTIVALSEYSQMTLFIEAHAAAVVESWRTREIHRVLMSAVARNATGGYDDSADFSTTVRAALEAISDGSGAADTERTWKEASLEHVKGVQAAYESSAEHGVATGLPTGLRDLDAHTSGLQNGELIVVAGRPAMGKSALGILMAMTAAQSGVGVMLFSLEMDAASMAGRGNTIISRVNGLNKRSGALSDGNIDRMLHAIKTHGDLPITIDQRGGIDVGYIIASCRRRKVDRNLPPLGMIMIDYLQLLQGKGHSREAVVAAASRQLKGLAREMECPVVVLAQLNRGVEQRPNKRPLLSDLRDSGAIEQDADVVAMLYRDEYYDEESDDANIAEIIVTKFRGGATGTIRVGWDGPCTRFHDLPSNNE